MLKELLILILLLQISHAENLTSPNCDQYTEDPDWAHWPNPDCLELPRCLNLSNSYETCKTCGGVMLGHANIDMICIPSYFKLLLSHPPYNRVPMKDGKWNCPLTDINILMRNVQVISIETHTITVSMNLVVYWYDYRLKVWKYSPNEYLTWMYLSKDFRNLIWFPNIEVANKMLSKKKQDEQFGLLRWENNSIPLVFRKFYLSISVNCEMDFQNFPFDKHDCKLEVYSIYVYCSKVQHNIFIYLDSLKTDMEFFLMSNKLH